MQDNPDNIYQFDGSEDQTPLTPDMEALDRRLMQDAAQWDAESPDTGALAAYALALAAELPAIAVTDGKVISSPAPASRITPRLQPLVPRRPSAWAAYIVTLGIVAAMALVLLWPSLLPHTPTVDSPTPTANAPVATDTSLPMGTSTTSPTATTSGGADAGFTVTRVIPTLDPLTTSLQGADWLSTGPTTLTSSTCQQTVTVDLDFTFDVSNQVNRGWITFRWRTSNGFVSDPIPFPFAGADGQPVIYRQWDFPAIQANGAKWVDVEVLQPNPITARLNFQATCQFSVLSENASASPAAYNCTAGGDQTITVTGSFGVSYAPGNHTITYHWWRSDGTASASQTVTVAEGVGSVSVPPDHWIIHQADVGPGKSASEQLVADSPMGSPGSSATISTSCP